MAGCKKKSAKPVTPPVGAVQSGIASWYGNPYHGRRAANGEIFDMEQFTAAHRTFSFGTWVRVHNLDNGKLVEVRITDRGPFIRGRIIDLSRAAARSIAMLGPGIAKVRLEVIRAPEVSGAQEHFTVQVGSFRVRENAGKLREQMQARYGTTSISRRDADPPQWRVLVGAVETQEQAEELAGRIRSTGAEAFVVRKDEP
ncbi:MAG: septal ring lytic transglycosylase RlpA family protein [Acidobacteriia bacterium]|nr:septal ring lytic transglycosylase RlpA family protein [Terriglobia bacterium]